MGGVGGDINVHVPCLHTWMLRCCYVTGHGWGGGDINVHVPCLHTWMLRCCYGTGHGWGGGILTFMYLAYIRGCYAVATSLGMGGVGGILTFMYLAYIRGCYAAANFWNTWKTSSRRIDAVRWGKKEANPGIDKVVTSFQKSIKIIVSLRRKRHFANFPMEISHKKCIHLKLEKSPYKRTENQCWMILNLHFEPRPSMRRVPSWDYQFNNNEST